MKKIFNSIIIGGGASGLCCAVELTTGKNAVKGNEILILEKNDRIGKKLIVTGNGQGNLTNENMTKEFYHGEENFIEEFLAKSPIKLVENFFERIGIFIRYDGVGRGYPLSKQASSVLDALMQYIEYKEINVETLSTVERIEREDNLFKVTVKDKNYYSKNLVISFGGKAGKQFGTDGRSYSLIKDFNHTTTSLYPALVQLKTEKEKIRGLKGIRERARVTAYSNKKPLKSVTGDVIFTDYGVSGNAIFSVSGYLSGINDKEIGIEFLPEEGKETLYQMILTRRKNSAFIKEEDILSGILNKKVGKKILSLSGKNINEIVDNIKDFRLKVTGSLDFEYAQVTKGGIDTKDIDGQTFESKLQRNMYIVGEALNVDGDCGGYNLTFAFTSGIIAGKSIKERA